MYLYLVFSHSIAASMNYYQEQGKELLKESLPAITFIKRINIYDSLLTHHLVRSKFRKLRINIKIFFFLIDTNFLQYLMSIDEMSVQNKDLFQMTSAKKQKFYVGTAN